MKEIEYFQVFKTDFSKFKMKLYCKKCGSELTATQ